MMSMHTDEKPRTFPLEHRQLDPYEKYHSVLATKSDIIHCYLSSLDGNVGRVTVVVSSSGFRGFVDRTCVG